MSEKLTWVELRKLVAERAGVKEQEAGRFLAALVQEVNTGLKTDKQVKLSGLGTFKLQSVAPRKSVNVTTGETIIIDGYSKVNFTAEAGAKELIESVGNNTAAVAPKDDEATPLRKLGEQAEEIVDLLAELGQAPVTAEDIPEAPVEEPIEETIEEPIVEETTVEESTVEEPTIKESQPETPQPEEPKQEEPKQRKRPSRVWRWIRDVIIAVIFLLLLLFGGIYLLREGLAEFLDSLAGESSKVEQVEAPQPTEAMEITDVTETAETAEATEATSATEPAETMSATESTQRVYTEFITTEEMHQDSRLTWMAYRYYGNKDLWVFIYEANMDHIHNPNYIQVGTPIRVPKLSAELRDVTNPNTQRIIQELKTQFGD